MMTRLGCNIIYEPGGHASDEKMMHSRDVPKMTPGRAALVGLMYRYLEGLLDPFVTLLEIHKLIFTKHSCFTLRIAIEHITRIVE